MIPPDTHPMVAGACQMQPQMRSHFARDRLVLPLLALWANMAPCDRYSPLRSVCHPVGSHRRH